jgi:hypothetical protein
MKSPPSHEFILLSSFVDGNVIMNPTLAKVKEEDIVTGF